MPDSGKTMGKYMLTKQTKEFFSSQGSYFLFVVVTVIFPCESHSLPGHLKYSLVGDSTAMSVSAQVTNHLLRAAKGLLCINNPLFAEKLLRQSTTYDFLLYQITRL